MVNLLTETIEEMHTQILTVEDIVFIGSLDREYSCTWDEFKVLADKKYNSGYGSAEVVQDLIIEFKGGIIMERMEYDGSKWWSTYKPWTGPNVKGKEIKDLFTGFFGTLGGREKREKG